MTFDTFSAAFDQAVAIALRGGMIGLVWFASLMTLLAYVLWLMLPILAWPWAHRFSVQLVRWVRRNV